MGQLIAIEGIDGSGKATQTALLVNELRRCGQRTATLSFPRYADTHYGRMVGRYLNGDFGPMEGLTMPFIASLYAGDRLESRELLRGLLQDHDFVVLDRYVASNQAYSTARLMHGPHQTGAAGWIAKLEYEFYGLPRPDRVVLLDLPAEIAAKQVALKRGRAYTKRPADLHEANLEYMLRVRAMYRELATEPPWSVTSCVDREGRMRSVHDIAADVLFFVLHPGSQRLLQPVAP